MPTVGELKAELKALGLPTSGIKAELEKRLADAKAAEAPKEEAPKAGKKKKAPEPEPEEEEEEAPAKKQKGAKGKKAKKAESEEEEEEEAPPKKGAKGKKAKKAESEDEEEEAPKKAAKATKATKKAKAEAEEPPPPEEKKEETATTPATSSSSSTNSSLEDLVGPRWSMLVPVISSQPKWEKFLGTSRSKAILPLRELTFRALQANDPQHFKVIIFGEAPYPRIESATGIALFDGKYLNWENLGKCASLREMIKSACMWKYKIPKSSNAEEVRAVLRKHDVVPVQEWFQSTLVQGCLWLNASLTMDPDAKAEHKKFWKPILQKIIEEILNAKKGGQGCVFALWGRPAQELRPMVEALGKSTKVPVKFIEGWNPAASAYGGKADFCENDNYGLINESLKALGMTEIDWCPSRGWESKIKGLETKGEDVTRMGNFMQETLDLHKFFLERLGEVSKEGGKKIASITGIRDVPLESLEKATKKVIPLIPSLAAYVKTALEKVVVAEGLSKDEAAAVYLYTMESNFYKDVNANLREANRDKILPFFPYLRLLLAALEKLAPKVLDLWRGVKLDLRKMYPLKETVVWWGISSCTPKRTVAEGFMGGSGVRTLFRIVPKSAISIMSFSAFKGEEEYILPPGTQLHVESSTTDKSGLTTIVLRENVIEKLVC